ncbi:hypothetical protein B0A48_18146 [Cryoendolithus antarcticus]|uniref:Integral membrane protein n=1 Tax=Cryoendolithus antarcticus TaxID=1507870 RepID=A0A1V8SAG5_9PEZI|nr:hypothetical protein B0A48_18146 [Cryoendolithus antarcticus]
MSVVAGHDIDHGHMDMAIAMSEGNSTSAAPASKDFPPNYFRHPGYPGWIYAHIILLILSWVVVLPPAIMFSVARSRYSLVTQMVFHAFNGAGMVTGFVYSRATPDLYTGEAHSLLGYVVTSLTVIWTLASAIATLKYSNSTHIGFASNHAASRHDIAPYAQLQQYEDSPVDYHSSRDSGNFSSGSRGSSVSGSRKEEDLPELPPSDESHTDEHNGDKRKTFLGNGLVERFLSRNTARFVGQRIFGVARVMQILLDKLLLLLGFTAITSGFVVYGGIFRDREILSGMAHYVKGAIFLWYGMLTLGRWMGSFQKYGWAWNVRPAAPRVFRWQSRIPSPEFTESFVIWLYGATNVWAEHMNAWGKAWSPQDFEHVSITILFFGGGLLGMIIESGWIGKMLNTGVEMRNDKNTSEVQDSALAHLDESDVTPPARKMSMNPMPALVIMLLGMMMSSHHQSSMVATMLHAQWGMLFSGFALARGLTYILMYLKPPTTVYPSRPPTELVASFCLIAGGVLFMNSSHDGVRSIEYNGLDAMTIFTLTMGMTGVFMAWEVVCYALMGWAVRRESSKEGIAS